MTKKYKLPRIPSIIFFIFYFFTITFLLISYFKFQTNINNFVGEKLFLTFHLNNMAKTVLESSEEKDNETYFLLGRIYFVRGELQKSVQQYSEAIKLNPNKKEYYYGRGLSYGFASPFLYEDAEKDFQKYIEIENSEFEKTGKHAYGAWAGYNDLAWIYFLKGNFDDAEKTAKQGLEISKYNPWLLNMLGVVQLEKQECADAVKNLKSAENLMKGISKDKFGEAYSGDNPDFWEIGKNEMQKTIEENLQLCTFPQSTSTIPTSIQQ